MQAPFRGTVRVDGDPIRSADVLLLDAAGKVVAATQTDEAGGYRLAPPAGFSSGMLLARLYRPIVGARATAVTHPADTGFDFAMRDTVALTGDSRRRPARRRTSWTYRSPRARSMGCRRPRRWR